MSEEEKDSEDPYSEIARLKQIITEYEDDFTKLEKEREELEEELDQLHQQLEKKGSGTDVQSKY